MKKSSQALIAFLLLLVCCTPEIRTVEGEQSQDNSFENFKNHFVGELWRLNPTWAIYEGYYKYAGELIVPDEKQKQDFLISYQALKDSLQVYEERNLGSLNQIDLKLMQNHVDASMWYTTEFKGDSWNPSAYNVGGPFDRIIKAKYKPLDGRLRDVYNRMENIPAYYAQARRNIKNPTIPHTQLAVGQNKGALSIFESTLLDSLQQSTLSEEEKKNFTNRVNQSVKAIRDYAAWLEFELLPGLNEENSRNYRLGEEHYKEKFNYDIVSGLTVDELYDKAQAHKEWLHGEMIKTTADIWTKYFPDTANPGGLESVKMMIDTLSANHVSPDSFIIAIKQQIPELEKFVREKDLLYLDPSKPLVVRETPKYMQGVAGASISAPGPYEKDAATFYNVTPLDHYSPEQAESYLREYNHYILQILNIHEAIPGHYTQLVYSNKAPSIIKSILSNGAMVEGWAVYTERMMLEEGYGNNEPEMWLMYYKWNMRTTCNTILDIGVHTRGMTEEEAMDLLMRQAFQEQAEAEGKWRRVQLSQVQLTSYFTGYAEIMDLRDELKEKQGENFDLKAFHEQFLSYGSAPVKYIRDMMLKDL